MTALFIIGIALAGTGIGWMILYMVYLGYRVRRLEGMQSLPAMRQELPEPYEESPLQGLRFVVVVEQDHPHAVFSTVLKEQLLREDASEVEVSTKAALDWQDQADILITGQITCNGYAEVYYSADLTCHGPKEPICTLVERPPHGDRPLNLANDLIARLRRELDKNERRDARRQALRELGPP